MPETVQTDATAGRAQHVELLEDELQRKNEVISRLRSRLEDDGDVKTYTGTPHLSGEVASKLSEGSASPYEFEAIHEEDLVLHHAIRDGPEAFVGEHTPEVYPVHERAHEVLTNAPSLAQRQDREASALFLTAPTVKRFLEATEETSLKHTQIRRVFETIRDAGEAYPRPPTLHKNRDDVIELVVYDYPRLFDHSLLD